MTDDSRGKSPRNPHLKGELVCAGVAPPTPPPPPPHAVAQQRSGQRLPAIEHEQRAWAGCVLVRDGVRAHQLTTHRRSCSPQAWPSQRPPRTAASELPLQRAPQRRVNTQPKNQTARRLNPRGRWLTGKYGSAAPLWAALGVPLLLPACMQAARHERPGSGTPSERSPRPVRHGDTQRQHTGPDPLRCLSDIRSPQPAPARVERTADVTSLKTDRALCRLSRLREENTRVAPPRKAIGRPSP